MSTNPHHHLAAAIVFALFSAAVTRGGENVVFMDEPPVCASATSSPVISARVEPLCVQAGLDTCSISVGVDDPNITGVGFLLGTPFTYAGVPAGWIDLYDDGTHGDQAAADLVFTLDQISVENMSGTIGKRVIRSKDITLTYVGGTQDVVNVDLGLTFHWISPTLELPPVWQLANFVIQTPYAVSIQTPYQGTFPDLTFSRTDVAQTYYSLFPDDRDFLFICMPLHCPDHAASFGVVRNDIQGIGHSIFDFSGDYGSSGVLHGLMNIYWSNVEAGMLLNHELLHRWAVALDPSLDLGVGHWSVVEGASTGFGGPKSYAGVYMFFEHRVGDLYRCWNDESFHYRYNAFELYLMGLMPMNGVPSPMKTLISPTWLWDGNDAGQKYSEFSASGIREVSMADIVAVEGPRSPDVSVSQKHFKSALIVAYDRLLTPVELAYYDYAMREYEKPESAFHGLTFEDCTGGLATLETRLRFPDVRVEAITSMGNGGHLLQWASSMTGLAYRVEVCTDMTTAAWAPASPTSQWPILSTSWTNPPSANEAMSFRVLPTSE